MISLSVETWRKVQEINIKVNHGVKYLSDQENYGKREHWSFPADGLGDCEDFAIAKRRMLEECGIKSYFATCWTHPDRKVYHAVLLIDTDRGTLVLDNRDDAVWTHDQLGYEWHKRETENGIWREILS